MKKIISVLLILCMFLITGCSYSSDIKKMAVISGIGIDKISDNNYKVYMQIFIPKKEAKSDMSLSVMSASGESIAKAIENISLKYNKQPYLSHNKILILSESLARDGIKEHLDFIGRDIEMRESMPVAVCRGDIGEFMSAENDEMHEYSGNNIKDVINISEFDSNIYSVSVLDIYKIFANNSSDLILPYLNRENESRVEIEGFAVFSGENLQYDVSINDMRGVFWVRDKVKNSIEIIKSPTSEKDISMRVKKSSCRMKPIYVNNTLSEVNINIKTGVNIIESGNIKDLNNDVLGQMKNNLNNQIKSEIMYAADKYMTGSGIDIFGFRHFDHKVDLKNVKINIAVDSDIISSGLINGSI